LFAYAASQIPAGFLADRVNNFRMLALGSILLAITGAAFAFAHDLPTALAYRTLMGVGAAVSYTSGFRLLANAFPGAHRAFALGTMEAAGGVGMLLSLTVLPLLAARLAPKTLFLALSLALVPVGALTLRAPGHRPPASRSMPMVMWRKVCFRLVLVLLIGFSGMIAIYGILT
ncbi:MAG: MFS transporter, partial [Clostridia bacterium]|nr:MFS transporter [Clostridia bacterium]